MTKNGSSIRKARIRTEAQKAGSTYRRAAKALDETRAEDELIAQRASSRTHPDELTELREVFVSELMKADLPDTVKVVLFALSARLNTARLIDTNGVHCSFAALKALTGLQGNTLDLALSLAQSCGWITEFRDDEARLTYPGEETEMWMYWLAQERNPVGDIEAYKRVHKEMSVFLDTCWL